MYFINTSRKLKSNTFLLHILPAGTVLITVLGLTLLGWRNAREAYTTERQTTINQINSDTQSGIRDKLSSYELMLRGAAGLFTSSSRVDRNEWNSFTSSFDVQKNYPGILGLGYAVHATPGEVAEVVRDAKRDGLKDFAVSPAGARPEYVINLYFEPLRSESLGFDMLSEPARKSAIINAKDTGHASITGRLNFTNTLTVNQGFSMYMPVYTNGQEFRKPVAERQIRGYVYAPFSAEDFFRQALAPIANENYAIRIYDEAISDKNLLYETNNFKSLNTPSSTTHSVPFELFGRHWVMDFRLSPNIVEQTTRNRPLSSLIIGTMLSLLLAGFVLTLLITRTRVLAHAKQLEVQSAKDELLSLASHQLRTPATSVKQYIGMTLEGFAGKLSRQQQNLLEKAYESNERQLHIINEILYVAKLDAKGIVLTPRRINLNKLMRGLTQELAQTAKKSSQKIRLQMPMKQVYIEADEHSLRMALENLISNALKYSHEGKTVSIKLTVSKNEVQVSVKDRGVGIDAADQQLLFQRFSRIPNELSRQTSGSGIGLYLSQQLIELHSGTISVESIKGKGTTFTVKLPKTYKPDGSQR